MEIKSFYRKKGILPSQIIPHSSEGKVGCHCYNLQKIL